MDKCATDDRGRLSTQTLYREDTSPGATTDWDAVSDRTLKEFASHSGRELTTWASAFSDLTLDFPVLHASIFPKISAEMLAYARTTHVDLLVFSFLEDRFLDGQMRATPERFLFARHLCIRAQHALQELNCSVPMHSFNRLEHEYIEAQAISTGIRRLQLTTWETRSCVIGRAALGSATIMRLAEITGADEHTLSQIRRAYAALVLGLQWIDDAEDWRQDLDLRVPNLLLLELRRRGWDAYGHPNDRVREPNVGHALAETGTLDWGVDRAARWLEASIRRYEAMGCMELQNRIDFRRSELELARERLKARVLDDVSRALTGMEAGG